MPEQPNQAPNERPEEPPEEPPEARPEQTPERKEKTASEPASPPSSPSPQTPDASRTPSESGQATGPAPAQTTVAGVGGRRVTRRTVDRSEVTEHTVETISEDIPLEAYQGPSSTHPAPVG